MAEDSVNTCCASWRKKHSKLLEKYSKLEELKNKFRDCTSLVNQQYDVIEKENATLKQELGNLKAQSDGWKDEKEQEYSIRLGLESEVSSLKKEIQVLQQNGKGAPNESGKQLQERLNVAELEINKLKELLEKERCRANLEKKNADMEKKKANEALKKLEGGKNKASEAQKAVDIERKKAEENKVLYEKLKSETDAVKSKLCLERSKSETANKKVEDEKQNTIKERKKAESAVFRAEEQQKLAETNLKKAIVEKDRADDLDKKLKEEKRRTEKLEKELRGHLCSRKLAETHICLSTAGIDSVLRNDVGTRMAKGEALISQGIDKMVKEKDQFSFREKKCVDSEVKKVAKHKKFAEAHEKKAVEEQYRVEQLSRELEDCKQILEELQKRQQILGRMHVDNPAVREKSKNSDRAIVKLRKKQKKLEKMLLKHAKEVTKVDVRNNLLHQELFHIKKRFHKFQERLDILDFCFVHGEDDMNELEKACNETSTEEKFYTDGCLKQLVSGIDPRLNPLYRGSYRKMLKSSALSSSTASFSYLPLIGSQERGAFSVTSAKPGEDISNPKSSLSKLSCEGTIVYRKNVVTNTKKNMKSSTKGNVDNRVRHRGKRKILGAVESMEKLYSKGQKLHGQMSKQLSVFHDMLRDHKDDSAEQNLLEDSCAEKGRPIKRRKTSTEGTKTTHSLHGTNGREGILDTDINNSDVGRKASSPGIDLRKCDQCLKDGLGNYSESTKCTHREFAEMPIYDYMKLLDLENAADEKSYRIAIAAPISPTLPEITFLGDEALDTNDADISVKDNLVSTSGVYTIDMEKNRKHSENLGVEHVSDACYCHKQVLGEKLGLLEDVSESGNEKTHLSCESSITSTAGALPNYFVISLDYKDDCSVSRIVQAINRCKPQCTPLHTADVFLPKILLSLEKAEDLSSKEKICVFFSILMLGISEIEKKNLANFLKCNLVQSLDSATLQICSALSDLVVRGIFMESFDLFDLLALIEDFLLQRKVLVCGGLSSEAPVAGSSNINVVVNGNTVILSEQAALVYQLVAGGCLLASLCLALDHVGFICETSCVLFAMAKFDPAVVLAILHSFAHICGSQYFSLQPYSLEMTVVKSLVMALEKQASSSNCASTSSSMVEMASKNWSCCTDCLFSEGVVSMEVIASHLLENLQKCSKSCSLPQDSLASMNSFVPIVLSNEEITKEVSGLRQAVSLIATSNESLCNFVDILSLVEIISYFMRWEWTFDNFISGLLEILESCAIESFCAAILLLLNQLGRLGVDFNGYEDTGIKKLRDSIFAFFRQSTSRNLSIPVQFASVSGLLGLIPISCEEIFDIESQSILSQESYPADFIRRWFSLLGKEQQLSFKLHHTGRTRSQNQDSTQTSVLSWFD